MANILYQEEWLEKAISDGHVNYLEYNKFTSPAKIGSGGFGKVFKYEWKDSELTVALKCLGVDKSLDEKTNKDFVNELKLLRRVSSHPNIVRFYGVTKDSYGYYNMVLQYANEGTLREFLKANFTKLQWIDKLRIAKEIAVGLSFLHDNNIIHRNLHSKNILIHQKQPKIADFGLSKPVNEMIMTSNSIVHGMPAYIDPQCFFFSSKYKRNMKSDVYSLGVILWEISSGRPPFSSFELGFFIAIHISHGNREEPVEGTPPQYIELYKKCWDNDPDNRPETRLIYNTLKKLITNETSSHRHPIESLSQINELSPSNQDNINALVNSFETMTSSPLNLSDTINSITSALKNSIHENLRKETILDSINIPESVSNDTNHGSLGVSNDVVSGIQKVTVVPRVPRRQIQRDAVPLRNLPVQGSSTAFHKKKEKGNVIPPINVLIVEDNSDTQLLLSAFMKEKDIKYECASNGQEAVDKWKKGGFHVILMATIMPVMDGIEATKTIRCLEKAQKIDVFPCLQSEVTTTLSTSTSSDTSTHKLSSPVIIMALTASSSPSERHKVLAAGCNDFLTKPVNLELLEKKISDWGCMQALIDFDGWQRWKSCRKGTQIS